MLKIRRFALGSDEGDWVRVQNAAFKEYDDDRQITVDEFRIAEKAPSFDVKGRFIAELDDQAVGIIHAHIDLQTSLLMCSKYIFRNLVQQQDCICYS